MKINVYCIFILAIYIVLKFEYNKFQYIMKYRFDKFRLVF